MGLLVLIVIGAVAGWLISIATRIEDNASLLLNLGTGVLGAVGAGLAVYHGPLSGMTVAGLALGSLAALCLIMVMNVVREPA